MDDFDELNDSMQELARSTQEAFELAQGRIDALLDIQEILLLQMALMSSDPKTFAIMAAQLMNDKLEGQRKSEKDLEIRAVSRLKALEKFIGDISEAALRFPDRGHD